ncbi:precursor of CEP7-like [Senna tora]|uniref:Precursor of CEP7-like n=1 Tax=Senna tora TaxID=362788 RepID=A0A834SSU7_9FABA|nr:precursor of CEP7-like [Senna tora]
MGLCGPGWDWIDGRNLRQSNNNHSPTNSSATKSIGGKGIRPNRNLEGYVDAFRPTNPGHSPGVGHSIKT